MATHELRPIYPVDGGDNADFDFRNWPVKSGETFLKGSFLVDATDGEVAEAGENPSAIIGVSLAGAADYDWQYDTFGTVVPSMPFATADTEFRGTLVGTIADVSAVIGATYGVTKQASGYWAVDSAKSSSNQRVRITGVDGEAADGDVNIPVTFVILPANQVVIK